MASINGTFGSRNGGFSSSGGGGFGSILNNIVNGATNIATNFANDFGKAYIPNYTPITNNNWGNAAVKKEEPKYYQPSVQDLISQTANSALNNIDFAPKTPNIQELTKNFKDGLNNISDVFDEDSLFGNVSKAVKNDKKEDKTSLENIWNNFTNALNNPQNYKRSMYDAVGGLSLPTSGEGLIDPLALPAQAYAEDYANANQERRNGMNIFSALKSNAERLSDPEQRVKGVHYGDVNNTNNSNPLLNLLTGNKYNNNSNDTAGISPIDFNILNTDFGKPPISQEYSPMLEIGSRSKNYSSPLDAINKAGKLQQDLLIDQIYNNDFYDAYDAAHNLAPGERYTSFKDIPLESLQEENRRNNVAREQAEWQKKNPNSGTLWRLDDLNKANQLNLEAINADPDDANRKNQEWVNKADEAAKLFSNDYVYTDMPLFAHRYVQDEKGAARRGANSETWMPLIDTEAAPKEYDQMDRFNYFIDNTPYGQEWINAAVPDAYQDGDENIFSKFRLSVLDNIDRYNNGEMNIGDMGDATSLMWADIFSDATGIPLERGADGKLTDESRTLVNAWTQDPENIFFLGDMLADPLNYINDPTFLNYGFDANAILDLTQFLINHGMNPYDVFQAEDIVNKQLLKNSNGKFNGSISELRNLNDDDVADYMLTSLIAQNAKLRENGWEGFSNNNSSIGLKDAQFIRGLAGQPNLTDDISLADTTNRYNKPLDLHPYAEETPFLPYVYDKENDTIVGNPTLSSQFTDTILKYHPEWYVVDQEKANEKNNPQINSSFTTSEYSPDVQLNNPMWW